MYSPGGPGHLSFVGWRCPVLPAELPFFPLVRDGSSWTVFLVRAFPWDAVCALLFGARRLFRPSWSRSVGVGVGILLFDAVPVSCACV